MNFESKIKCTEMDGMGILIVKVIWFVPVKEFVYESRRDFIASKNTNTVQPQI